jgi:hypothetical protein
MRGSLFERGPGRPVEDREHTFRPNYLMLYPVYQCGEGAGEIGGVVRGRRWRWC